MKIIAMTGATGFVGQTTVHALRRAYPDAQLRLLIRNARGRRLPERFLDCTVIGGTLDSPETLNTLVRDADCVVHIAAAIRGNSAPDFERDNICGTRRLVEAVTASAPDAHLIHLSSLAARRPELSWYAASKRAAEEAVAANCRRRFSILRPPAVYGPEDIALAGFWRALARGWLIRAGTSESRFSMVHVDDLADAVCRLAKHGPTSKCMPLAGPQPDAGWRWDDLADLAEQAGAGRVRIVPIPGRLLSAVGAISVIIFRIMGRGAMLSPGKARELLHRDWVCDNLDIEECLNWKPTTRLEHTLGTLPGWTKK